MNCKQGDLAIIVCGVNAGKIVEVLEYLGENPLYAGFGPWNQNAGPSWLVSTQGSKIVTDIGIHFAQCPAPDAWLRPIRPGELADETEDSRELEVV